MRYKNCTRIIKIMEENQMNMYDEMLNKYAQFLGYEGKVKADEKYLLSERDKLERLIRLNDELDSIDKHSKAKNYGRTILACYESNFAYKSEGEPACQEPDPEMIIFKICYAKKVPCICFEIDVRGNTYREITFDEVTDILHLG